MTKHLAKVSTSRSLLQKIFEEPKLVSIVQSLSAQVLGKLIEHVGLEDSGEIVALATTSQLEKIFDQDLWKNERPGKEEVFDEKRFTLWLQILSEMGSKPAADKIAEMNEDFVCMALSHAVFVVNVDELALQLSERGEKDRKGDLLEKALESSLGQEFEQFWVLSKHPDSWDSVLGILLSLDESDHGAFLRIIERLNTASNDYIEDNGGLYNVLTSAEQLDSDVAYDRELRREKEGFVAPQTAASFLKLASATKLEDLLSSNEQDPVSQSYFRNYESSPFGKSNLKVGPGANAVTHFLKLLQEAAVLPVEEHALLLRHKEKGSEKNCGLNQAMEELASQDPSLYAVRIQELNFLANVLMAGVPFQGGRFRPSEAAEEAVSICESGMSALFAKDGHLPTPIEILNENDLVKLFKIGWNLKPS